MSFEVEFVGRFQAGRWVLHRRHSGYDSKEALPPSSSPNGRPHQPNSATDGNGTRGSVGEPRKRRQQQVIPRQPPL